MIFTNEELLYLYKVVVQHNIRNKLNRALTRKLESYIVESLDNAGNFDAVRSKALNLQDGFKKWKNIVENKLKVKEQVENEKDQCGLNCSCREKYNPDPGPVSDYFDYNASYDDFDDYLEDELNQEFNELFCEDIVVDEESVTAIENEVLQESSDVTTQVVTQVDELKDYQHINNEESKETVNDFDKFYFSTGSVYWKNK